jgi:hypothetical protein
MLVLRAACLLAFDIGFMLYGFLYLVGCAVFEGLAFPGKVRLNIAASSAGAGGDIRSRVETKRHGHVKTDAESHCRKRI